MSNEANTPMKPKRRFPEFEGNSTWTVRKLSDLLYEAKRRNRDLELGVSDVLSVSGEYGCVNQIEFMGRSYAGVSVKDYHVVEHGDIVYTKSPLKKNPYGIIKENKGMRGIVSTLYAVYRPLAGCSPTYLDHFFSGDYNLNAYLQPIVKKGAKNDMKVNNGDVLKGDICVPALPEQQKIADCLTSLDELIAAQTRKVDALKAHKNGVMQQLLPCEGETQPRLRFPEFKASADWEVKKLEDLAKRGSGHTPSKNNPEHYDGGIKWVSLADSKRLDAGLISETEAEISALGIKNSSAVLHAAGTVLVSRDASVGKSAVMAWPMAVSQHFIVWTCHAKLLSNWFLYYLLQQMKPVFERVATGSTIKTIGLPFFKELLVAVPTLPEQQRIADCLLSLDDHITAAAQALETLKTHKKGLMQQLFPSVEALDA